MDGGLGFIFKRGVGEGGGLGIVFLRLCLREGVMWVFRRKVF